MLGKIIMNPIGAGVTAVVVGAGATGTGVVDDIDFNDISLDSITSLITKKEEPKEQKSCFTKEQELKNSRKQGINVCFTGGLENVSFEYYGVKENGIRVNKLIDSESFENYLSFQDLNTDISRTVSVESPPLKDNSNQQTEPKVYLKNASQEQEVKGVSEKTLENYGKNLLDKISRDINSKNK